VDHQGTLEPQEGTHVRVEDKLERRVGEKSLLKISPTFQHSFR